MQAYGFRFYFLLVTVIIFVKIVSRLISCIHHTCEYKQYCHVGNTAKQSRLGLFQNEPSKFWDRSVTSSLYHVLLALGSTVGVLRILCNGLCTDQRISH